MPRYAGNIEQGPAQNAIAITPNDGTDFSFGQCRSFYVGVSGDVVFDTVAQTNVTLKAAPVGYHPIAAVRIRATGTTATNILGLY